MRVYTPGFPREEYHGVTPHQAVLAYAEEHLDSVFAHGVIESCGVTVYIDEVEWRVWRGSEDANMEATQSGQSMSERLRAIDDYR